MEFPRSGGQGDLTWFKASIKAGELQCDREQELLLPPSLREWLPAGHLAWFVLEAVEQFDLTAFYRPIAAMVGAARRTIRR